ncbi:LOB domain-containing protein 2-like [Phoenix dactylifera]|uniref:LOB domain-containing protein 2-like n=1 Tax=Phoenix dactylifera TaxID=42345 RepID=A0A8B7BSK3_PHODC|nr:LOB domain-containing protein 2-like [Phoenix dactylifera]
MQRNVPHPLQPLPPPVGPAPAPAPAPVAGAGAGQGGHQACASCKHQRKKCSESCELAPYFPADRTREFGQVHKVYGVSNLTKMLKANDSIPERERCADTLMWEADWRSIDPANGCYNEVIRLKEENAMLRRVIRECGHCSRQPLPQPYRSPVPQPGRFWANGNNHNNNGGANLIRRGINNNGGDVGGAMHLAEVVPQHMVNYPLINNGNLINGYHNPHPPIYMHQPGGQGNNGHGALYH